MATYRILFAIFSALSFITVLWTGVREVIPEWKSYQSEYYELLGEKLEAQGVKNFQAPPLGVEAGLDSRAQPDRPLHDLSYGHDQ